MGAITMNAPEREALGVFPPPAVVFWDDLPAAQRAAPLEIRSLHLQPLADGTQPSLVKIKCSCCLPSIESLRGRGTQYDAEAVIAYRPLAGFGNLGGPYAPSLFANKVHVHWSVPSLHDGQLGRADGGQLGQIEQIAVLGPDESHVLDDGVGATVIHVCAVYPNGNPQGAGEPAYPCTPPSDLCSALPAAYAVVTVGASADEARAACPTPLPPAPPASPPPTGDHDLCVRVDRPRRPVHPLRR